MEQNDNTSAISQVATGVGIGLIAGLVGTAVMTAAQVIDMRMNDRGPSDTPYKALKKTFGVRAGNEEDKERLNDLTHFAYGTAWGIPRGVMAAVGVDGLLATATHMAAVWSTEMTALPAMDVMEPVTEWEPQAIGKDALFHGIYAAATGLTADLLTKWLDR